MYKSFGVFLIYIQVKKIIIYTKQTKSIDNIALILIQLNRLPFFNVEPRLLLNTRFRYSPSKLSVNGHPHIIWISFTDTSLYAFRWASTALMSPRLKHGSRTVSCAVLRLWTHDHLVGAMNTDTQKLKFSVVFKIKRMNI